MVYLSAEESVFGVGFLERLEANTKPVSFIQGPDVNDVVESIKRNVANILNSRVGGSESAPLLGLIDFNDATLESMDLSVRIKLAIQHCLERYEPRLKNILVIADKDMYSSMTLSFSITASINSAALHEKIRFSLLLDSNRKYRVY
ncbi:MULTISPECIES: type VI secretion system baseplate subunit TssE [Vibrio]|uniref:Type VI secretion system baseplate subunit TssE n=1 Tax=Vibrio diazotrophicus TaxID=685 RepID=A0A2J8HK63_VIBDI|nr:type VI secretion system baseplate subunit TssE [Vibrio diazotrophicus]MCZ4371678.1 type VI secretion system baseplate subunit TssE [Vibrio diazotrophicus]PNH98658.1 type VI secretion system baseplate subunit TssE [Vibrio diazotrophicus]PNI06477.1 type VI secretion system baseplate subunit TssE [Vibrio diazotrophicus]